MSHRNVCVCCICQPTWGNLKGGCSGENLATMKLQMFVMRKYSFSWPKAKGHLCIIPMFPCYRFMSKIKSVLSYAGPQHSGSPELLKYFVRKCCKWKHIGENQHNLITSLTFRISKTTSLTVLKWYHLKLVMEKDLVRVKNVFSSIIVI